MGEAKLEDRRRLLLRDSPQGGNRFKLGRSLQGEEKRVLLKNRFRQGFTLIEVLIVVVIIGVLASLILPRMFGQIERAKAAEAFMILGVIQRAASRVRDLAGGFPPDWIQTDNGVHQGDWSVLGLKDPGVPKNWGRIYDGGVDQEGTYGGVFVYSFDWKNAICRYEYQNGRVAWACQGMFQNSGGEGMQLENLAADPCVLK